MINYSFNKKMSVNSYNHCQAVLGSGSRRGQICNRRCAGECCGYHITNNRVANNRTTNNRTTNIHTTNIHTTNNRTTNNHTHVHFGICNNLSVRIFIYWKLNNTLKYLTTIIPNGSIQYKTYINHTFIISSKQLNHTNYNNPINKFYILDECKVIRDFVIDIGHLHYINTYLKIISNDSSIIDNYVSSLNNEDWKKPCIKTLSLLRNIKKLSSNDTVNSLCEMEEYIDFPKELTIRDFQEAGAAYQYEHNYNS